MVMFTRFSIHFGVRYATLQMFQALGAVVQSSYQFAVIDRLAIVGEGQVASPSNMRNRYQIIRLNGDQTLVGLYRSKAGALKALASL